MNLHKNMNNEVEIFKPGIAELKTMAEKFKGLEIKGVEDEAGYIQVKDARKELGDMRILITKTGKSAREEARKYASSVIEQEKEYLLVITPLEDELKAKIEAIDEAKKKAERIILLPSRKAMLAEIGAEMTDDEILSLDEKKFSEMYTAKKMAHLEEQDRKHREEEAEKNRAEELKQAKEKAKLDERDRLRRVEERRKEREAEQAAENKRIEDKRLADEKEKLEKEEKNKQYQDWLKKNGVDNTNIASYHIERRGTNSEGGTTFVMFKIIDTITIK
jgi:hypothetical protein